MKCYRPESPSGHLTILAGTPATVQPAGTDLVTTAFAPITAPSPIWMSPSSTQPHPNNTPSPILGTRSPGAPPPPGRANGHVLEKSTVPPYNRIRVNNTPQARVVKDARRINLCANTDIAAEKYTVNLPQEECSSVPQLTMTAEPVREQGNLQVLLIRHDWLPPPHRRTRCPQPSLPSRRSACRRTSRNPQAWHRSRAWRPTACPAQACGNYTDP